jgi:LacI family transcriptional regulator
LAAARLDKMMSGDPNENRCIVVKAGQLVKRQSTDGLAVDDAELASALRFIRDHACDPIRVDDVIREIPISRSTLESRFKHLLGTTIHAEIHRVQMDRAMVLLNETDLSFSAVARRAGIGSVQYLTTLIHRETGSTPAKIRHGARAVYHPKEST